MFRVAMEIDGGVHWLSQSKRILKDVSIAEKYMVATELTRSCNQYLSILTMHRVVEASFQLLRTKRI